MFSSASPCSENNGQKLTFLFNAKNRLTTCNYQQTKQALTLLQRSCCITSGLFSKTDLLHHLGIECNWWLCLILNLLIYQDVQKIAALITTIYDFSLYNLLEFLIALPFTPSWLKIDIIVIAASLQTKLYMVKKNFLND